MILKKDLIKIFFLVIILYSPMSYWDFKQAIDSIYDQQKKEAEYFLASILNRLQNSLEENDFKNICQQLNAEVLSYNIDIYNVNSAMGVCRFPNNFKEPPEAAMNPKVQYFNFKEHLFAMKGLKSQQYQIVLGKLMSPKKSILYYLREYEMIRWALVRELVMVLVVASIISLLLAMILAEQIKSLYKDNKYPWWFQLVYFLFHRFQLSQLDFVKTLSTKAHRDNSYLRKINKVIENSLEKTILNEIKSNAQSLPISFVGTIARVDINGFSSIVNLNSSQESFQLTEKMELIGTELLYRYKGLFEKTVGDEMVVVFRDQYSKLHAISFIRDVMADFFATEFYIQNEKKFFNIKGAFHTSEINFRKRKSGYAFDGYALTLTARLLSAVSIKDSNTLCCLKAEWESISELINEIPQEIELNFKNMHKATGMYIQQFKTIEQIFEEKNWKLLLFFKSDEAIIYLLDKLFSSSLIDEDRKMILNHLAAISVTHVSDQLIKKWEHCYKKLTLEVRIDEQLISLFISTANNLIPVHQWNSDLSHTMTRDLETIKEQRCVSSIIELLTYKDSKAILEYIAQNEFKVSTQRLHADQIIAENIHKLSRQSLKLIVDLFDSGNQDKENLGAYCAIRVIDFYQNDENIEMIIFPEMSLIMEKLALLERSNRLSPRISSLYKRIQESFRI